MALLGSLLTIIVGIPWLIGKSAYDNYKTNKRVEEYRQRQQERNARYNSK